ncbi:hypothetical protein T265_05453 [Opisthorchis viverrini]|uniref:Uncharacterized protein n=1 Tax=Opisthorchis viverrini TaxID=6198 RepID=A0A074ZJG5_OPIVI|nr:hypothetical protein T265_05453 [Opisthorchis viverrini]KER27488.1 hypothetical protein T265_05453 [Opisthorchis viverrini]
MHHVPSPHLASLTINLLFHLLQSAHALDVPVGTGIRTALDPDFRQIRFRPGAGPASVPNSWPILRRMDFSLAAAPEISHRDKLLEHWVSKCSGAGKEYQKFRDFSVIPPAVSSQPIESLLIYLSNISLGTPQRPVLCTLYPNRHSANCMRLTVHWCVNNPVSVPGHPNGYFSSFYLRLPPKLKHITSAANSTSLLQSGHPLMAT